MQTAAFRDTMAPMSSRVLVVEDEAPIREGITALLQVHGYTVDCAADGPSARELLARGGYALVVMDVMIPAPSGVELVHEMRARRDQTAVLMLTARAAEEDVVRGLETGADDYVTKPFSVRELVARVQSLVRRGSAPSPEDRARIALGTATLDPGNARIVRPGDAPIDLTARETALLVFLYANRHRVVSRAELLVSVWGYRDGSIETRTVDVHIQKLRQKLRALGAHPWIETLRALGYRLSIPS